MPLLAGRRDWQLAIIAGHTATGPQRRALEPRCRRAGSAGAASRPCVTSRASTAASMASWRGARASFRKSLRKSLRAAERRRHDVRERARAPSRGRGALRRGSRRSRRAAGSRRKGVGIGAGPMRAFYAAMLPRLCALGQQRTIFARHGRSRRRLHPRRRDGRRVPRAAVLVRRRARAPRRRRAAPVPAGRRAV